MTYNAEKKSYTVICEGKKFLTPEVWEKNCYLKITHTPLPHKRPTVVSNIKGLGKKRI